MTRPDCCSTGKAVDATVDVSAALAADPENAPEPRDDPEHACTSCRGASRPVTRKTVILMLRPDLLESVVEGRYRFCPDSECRVVYFAEGGGRNFTTADLRVRVGLKEREGEIPLCYCFGFDEAGAREEISRTGRSTVPQRIAALIKEGMCACPAKNPSGACCLGEVNKAIKLLVAETADADRPA